MNYDALLHITVMLCFMSCFMSPVRLCLEVFVLLQFSAIKQIPINHDEVAIKSCIANKSVFFSLSLLIVISHFGKGTSNAEAHG